MAAIEAITNALLSEVKANQEQKAAEEAEQSITNMTNTETMNDDSEPKLLRIIIYESNVWQYVQRFWTKNVECLCLSIIFFQLIQN